jgi:dTDP-4-amino-4,6-dideoxygalactose transaminase
MEIIPFNKPYFTGKETKYIEEAVNNGHISGNGIFTRCCQDYLEKRYGFKKCLLTSSCTDALEMASILLNIQPGDEVIAPSYTFVSTINPFILRGAKIVFVDSRSDHPGMDETKLESLITPNTKAIIPVHYAGVACDMDVIMELSAKYNLYVVEDAAQAINGYYTFSDGRVMPLGSIGHFATFSFHETKNIISGEGGMLVVNDEQFIQRSEIIWEKGTNRSAFFKGEVNKYGWVDVGSSYLPSEITAAFLWAQIEKMDEILENRRVIWNTYYDALSTWANINRVVLPFTPSYSTNNAHIFYLVFNESFHRDNFIKFLKTYNIHPVFHYQNLHLSEFYLSKNAKIGLTNCEKYTDNLVRLPLYQGVDVRRVIDCVLRFNC